MPRRLDFLTSQKDEAFEEQEANLSPRPAKSKKIYKDAKQAAEVIAEELTRTEFGGVDPAANYVSELERRQTEAFRQATRSYDPYSRQVMDSSSTVTPEQIRSTFGLSAAEEGTRVHHEMEQSMIYMRREAEQMRRDADAMQREAMVNYVDPFAEARRIRRERAAEEQKRANFFSRAIEKTFSFIVQTAKIMMFWRAQK